MTVQAAAAEQREVVGAKSPRLSVLVPVTLPAYPLERLYHEFSAPLKAERKEFEFLFIVQSADPEPLAPLRRLQEAGEPVRIVASGNAPPESALAEVARAHTTSPVLVTLPSYPRVDPRALVELVASLRDDVDLTTGARINRGDSVVNRLQRRGFHLLLGTMVGGRFADIASGVRAMRREVLEEMDLYGDYFRFVPMFAVRDGYRVLELAVEPHRDDRKTRVYAPGIYVRRLVDLVGLMLLVRFTYKPLRFFGLMGSAVAGVGGLILAVLFVERIGGRGIADRPMLLLGVLLVVLGMQALALGLIGEIVVHHNVSRRPTYRILRADEKGAGVAEPGASQPRPGPSRVE